MQRIVAHHLTALLLFLQLSLSESHFKGSMICQLRQNKQNAKTAVGGSRSRILIFSFGAKTWPTQVSWFQTTPGPFLVLPSNGSALCEIFLGFNMSFEFSLSGKVYMQFTVEGGVL